MDLDRFNSGSISSTIAQARALVDNDSHQTINRSILGNPLIQSNNQSINQANKQARLASLIQPTRPETPSIHRRTTARRSVSSSINQSFNPSFNSSLNSSRPDSSASDSSINQTNNQTIDWDKIDRMTSSRPTTAFKPYKPSTSQPINQSVNQLNYQSIDLSNYHSVNQSLSPRQSYYDEKDQIVPSIDQSIIQSSNRPVSEPTIQSNNQTTDQSTRKQPVIRSRSNKQSKPLKTEDQSIDKSPSQRDQFMPAKQPAESPLSQLSNHSVNQDRLSVSQSNSHTSRRPKSPVNHLINQFEALSNNSTSQFVEPKSPISPSVKQSARKSNKPVSPKPQTESVNQSISQPDDSTVNTAQPIQSSLDQTTNEPTSSQSIDQPKEHVAPELIEPLTKQSDQSISSPLQQSYEESKQTIKVDQADGPVDQPNQPKTHSDDSFNLSLAEIEQTIDQLVFLFDRYNQSVDQSTDSSDFDPSIIDRMYNLSINCLIQLESINQSEQSVHQLVRLMEPILQHRPSSIHFTLFTQVIQQSLKTLFDYSKQSTNDQPIIGVLPSIVGQLYPTNKQSNTPLKRLIDREFDCLVCFLSILLNVTAESEGQIQVCSVDRLFDCLIEMIRDNQTDSQVDASNDQSINQSTRHQAIVSEVAGVLRNIANQSINWPRFAEKFNQTNKQSISMIDCLIEQIVLHPTNASLALSVLRVLSKLSIDQSIRESLLQSIHLSIHQSINPSTQSIIQVLLTHLHRHSHKLPLCVRIAFMLGNLTGENDDLRFVSADCEVIIDAPSIKQPNESPNKKSTDQSVTDQSSEQSNKQSKKLLQSSITGLDAVMGAFKLARARHKKLLTLSNSQSVNQSSNQSRHSAMQRENLDLLTKLIRLLANLSMNQDVGARISINQSINGLFDLMNSDQSINQSPSDVEALHELNLNAINAAANLSFYIDANDSNNQSISQPNNQFCGTSYQTVLSKLSLLIFSSNPEVVQETVRCCGNLTRHQSFRSMFASHQLLDCCVCLIDHTNQSIVYACLGVLLNACMDVAGRQRIVDEKWVDQVIDSIDRSINETDDDQSINILDIGMKILLNLRDPSNKLTGVLSNNQCSRILSRVSDWLQLAELECSVDTAEQLIHMIELVREATEPDNVDQ